MMVESCVPALDVTPPSVSRRSPDRQKISSRNKDLQQGPLLGGEQKGSNSAMDVQLHTTLTSTLMLT